MRSRALQGTVGGDERPPGLCDPLGAPRQIRQRARSRPLTTPPQTCGDDGNLGQLRSPSTRRASRSQIRLISGHLTMTRGDGLAVVSVRVTVWASVSLPGPGTLRVGGGGTSWSVRC